MSPRACLVCQSSLLLKVHNPKYVEEIALEREVEGDLFLQDIGQGFGFRPGSFDGAIRSVSLTTSPLRFFERF